MGRGASGDVVLPELGLRGSTGRRERWGVGVEPEVVEDAADGSAVEDGGHQSHVAAATEAGEQVVAEGVEARGASFR